MYKYFIIAGLVILNACHKTAVEAPVDHPIMDYTEFNQEIPFGQVFYVDIDNNSSKDFLLYTVPADVHGGTKSYHYYQVGSSYGAAVAVDTSNEQTPVLAKNAVISANRMAKTDWFNASVATLTRKVTNAGGLSSWEGDWANARHQFVAVRVTRAGLNYYGWLEISFDTAAEKTVLHRSAICRQAEMEIKAGL